MKKKLKKKQQNILILHICPKINEIPEFYTKFAENSQILDSETDWPKYFSAIFLEGGGGIPSPPSFKPVAGPPACHQENLALMLPPQIFTHARD